MARTKINLFLKGYGNTQHNARIVESIGLPITVDLIANNGNLAGNSIAMRIRLFFKS